MRSSGSIQEREVFLWVDRGTSRLVLLLNPALEASVFTAMDSVRRPPSKAEERIHASQQPSLLVISTENDSATTTWFRLGQWLTFARMERQRKTLGNYMNYVTHTLQDLKSSAEGTKSNFWYDHFSLRGYDLS